MSVCCPLCVKLTRRLGTIILHSASAHDCQFCNGERKVEWAQVEPIGNQMQRVADAMQAGDAERAAAECRTAAHLALTLLVGRIWIAHPSFALEHGEHGA